MESFNNAINYFNVILRKTQHISHLAYNVQGTINTKNISDASVIKVGERWGNCMRDNAIINLEADSDPITRCLKGMM